MIFLTSCLRSHTQYFIENVCYLFAGYTEWVPMTAQHDLIKGIKRTLMKDV